MSHIASVKLFVTDLEALDAVCRRLGLELVRGTADEWGMSYAWYGRFYGDSNLAEGHDPKNFGKSQHKIRRADHQPGDYEIGLVRRPDGAQGWDLLYDNWSTGGQRIESRAGRELSTLKRELAAEISMRQLQRQGYRVTRSTKPTGEILLTAQGR
jgi:hypothetical protein